VNCAAPKGRARWPAMRDLDTIDSDCGCWPPFAVRSASMVSRSRTGDSVNAQPAQRNSARPGARRLPAGRRLHRPDRLRPHGPAPRRWPSTSTPSTTPSTWPPPECWSGLSPSQPPPPRRRRRHRHTHNPTSPRCSRNLAAQGPVVAVAALAHWWVDPLAVAAFVFTDSMPSQVNVETRQVVDCSRQVALLRGTIER
jgi:hypothetical protein